MGEVAKFIDYIKPTHVDVGQMIDTHSVDERLERLAEAVEADLQQLRYELKGGVSPPESKDDE